MPTYIVFEGSLVQVLSSIVYTVQYVVIYYLQGNFFLVCKFCFEKSSMLVTVRSSPETCLRCNNPRTGILVHVNGINNPTVAITQRRFVHSTAFYQLCYHQQFCQRRETCVHAHSQIERDVWYLQRDYNYSWLQIVDEVCATVV